MAITAAITLLQSTVAQNGKVSALCTISNSGATTSITGMAPYAYQTSNGEGALPCALGEALPPAGGNLSVPGSGSVAVPFNAVFFSPTHLGDTFSIGCICYTADGSTTKATEATVTITAQPTVG